MMHRLIVPLPLPGARIQRDHAVAKQIAAFPKRAVKILGRRTCGHEGPSSLLIDRHSAPGIGSTIVFAGYPLPGIMPQFALPGNRVESPFELSGGRIVRTDMSG